MTISVVIPVRDRWNALVDCLWSLVAQDCPPTEVIVVDDGSTRPMPRALREWKPPFALRFLRTPPLGIAAARNAGLAVAGGEVMVLTDSDCVFTSDCMAELRRAVRNRPGDVAFQLRFALEDKRVVWCIDSLAKSAKQECLKTSSGYIRYLDTGGFAIRRRYVEGHSPLFNVSDVRGSDTSLLARLWENKLLPYFVESARVKHRPVHSLSKFLFRHVPIGYLSSPARARLRAATDFLLTGARRAGVLRSAWSNASKCRLGRLCFGLLVAAYPLEVVGRIAYRAVGMRRGRTVIFGMPVECLDPADLQSRILSAAEQHHSACFTYLTAWSLVQLQRRPQVRQAIGLFDVRYADGFGVVLAALLLNGRRIRKVTANDFFVPMCCEIARRKLGVALVGGEPQVIREATEKLARECPELQVRLSLPGYLSPDDEESLQRSIAESQPDIVILGMGQPRQEQIALRLRNAGIQTVFLCVGGLFDYIAGRIRAPHMLVRRCGFEWLWKLGHAPRRFWRRYILGIPALGLFILREHFIRLKAFAAPTVQDNTLRTLIKPGWANEKKALNAKPKPSSSMQSVKL